MNVGINIVERKVSLVLGSGKSALTANLTPEDALIVAETIKHCAEILTRDKQRVVDKPQEKEDERR